MLVGDSMKRTEFLSHKHIVAASATPEIVYSLNDTLFVTPRLELESPQKPLFVYVLLGFVNTLWHETLQMIFAVLPN